MATEQDKKMESLLRAAGCPPLSGYVGQHAHGVWTFRSRDTAERALMLLAHAFHMQGPGEAIEYNKVDRGTCLRRTTYKVWRIWMRGPK